MYQHIKNYIDSETATEYFEILKKEIKWETFALAPKSRKVFHWKGENITIADFIITELVQKLETTEKVSVCGVFLNLYENGQNHCAYHKDLYNTDVYTLSFGETRDLLLKPDDKNQKTIKITLRNGDLYFMSQKLNENFRHRIPERKNITNSRISIVFFTHK